MSELEMLEHLAHVYGHANVLLCTDDLDWPGSAIEWDGKRLRYYKQDSGCALSGDEELVTREQFGARLDGWGKRCLNE